MTDVRLLKIKEFAREVNLSPVTIYNWCYQKPPRIKSVKLGRARRIPASEVTRLTTKGTA